MRTHIAPGMVAAVALLVTSGQALTVESTEMAQAQDASAPCGTFKYHVKYTNIGGHHTHAEAEKACQAKGGHLATVTSDEEHQLALASVGGKGNAWLGGSQAHEGRPWKWSSGVAFEYKNWNRNEPNNWGGKEDCLSISGPGWNDVKCSSKMGAICEQRWTATGAPESLGGHGDAFNGDFWGNLPFDWTSLPINWGKFPIDWNRWPSNWPYLIENLPEPEPEPPKKPVYSVSSNTMNFSSAESYCKEKGGQLASVLSNEEWTLLKSTLGNSWRGWLGGFQPEKDALWEWKSGWPFEFTHWNRNEPNNWGRNEDCLEISGWGWNDRKCSAWNRAICEVRARPPFGYKPPAPLYTAYVARKNHQDAQAFCKSKGGNLATVQSSLELEKLYNAMKAQGLGYGHIGARQETGSSRHDPWFWESGAKWEFSQWRRGEPNNSWRREDCAASYQNGWNDDQCSKRMGFICENRKLL